MYYNGQNGQTSKAMSRGVNDKIKQNQGHFLTCLMALQRFPQVLQKVGLKSPPSKIYAQVVIQYGPQLSTFAR